MPHFKPGKALREAVDLGARLFACTDALRAHGVDPATLIPSLVATFATGIIQAAVAAGMPEQEATARVAAALALAAMPEALTPEGMR